MKKILFVDHDKELHQLVMSFFPKEEYRVVCSSDGLEGIQKCRNEDFDYIILDFEIPKLDGMKFHHQLRDMQDKRKVEPTPILFLSARLEEVKSKNLKFIKSEFLAKPFTKDDMIQKMFKPQVKLENKIILKAGETLFSEGDAADWVYYVVQGSLEISSKTVSGRMHVLTKIGVGELLGEVSVLNKDKRLFTAIATEDSELIPIPSDKVLAIVESQPKWIKLMLENLSKRLREAVKQIS
jgi:CheY-like chemotaxis protein